jgi:hypothetical protein
MKNLLFLFGACLLQFGLSAQTTVNATGGEAIGGNVQMSFSNGEIVYTTASNTTYFLTQGEQQPYIPPFNFSINLFVKEKTISLNYSLQIPINYLCQ